MSSTHPNLTITRLFTEPDLLGCVPRQFRFSPDGSRLTCLRAGTPRSDDAAGAAAPAPPPDPGDLDPLHLFEYDLAAGQFRVLVTADSLRAHSRGLSPEEQASRERKRVINAGIIDYFWHPDSESLLFPFEGRLYRYQIRTSQLAQLTDDTSFLTDVRCSPDGRYISFIREKDLIVIEPDRGRETGLTTDRGRETRLTTDSSDTITNGLAEFIAQEEMHRYDGYWWSPDSRWIACLQVDESSVALSRRYEIEADTFNAFDQRYPFAGCANATVKLLLLASDGSTRREIEITRDPDSYVARVNWLSDSRQIAIQIQSRDQQRLDLLIYDLDSNHCRVVLTEQSDSWINLNDHFRSLRDPRLLIWGSERDGFCHLYLTDTSGVVRAQLTKGDWVVKRVVAIDEDRGLLYFEANRDTPLETQLYVVPLAGPHDTGHRITRPGFTHEVEFSGDFHRFIDRYSSIDQPPAVDLAGLDGDLQQSLAANRLNADHPFFPYLDCRGSVEFGDLAATDGQRLYYRLIRPQRRSCSDRAPLILTVYGGPGVQRVTNDWMPPWQHYMASQGYALLQVDNRGTSGRGKAFESPIRGQLGTVEVIDQLRVLDHVAGLDGLDPDRIGVFGHSYGGYMTLMLMLKAPDRFRAGVAVAPVTDWRLYDTHYTERYLGHPDTNGPGYEASSVYPYASNLQGALLLIHGMADDNVLFTHTTKLQKVLQEQLVQFDLMTYPGAKHGIVGRRTNIHRYTLMDRFFQRHLKREHD